MLALALADSSSPLTLSFFRFYVTYCKHRMFHNYVEKQPIYVTLYLSLGGILKSFTAVVVVQTIFYVIPK